MSLLFSGLLIHGCIPEELSISTVLMGGLLYLVQREGNPIPRDGKNHDFFKKIENIEKIENIGYFRYISDFFDIYPIHI